MYRISDKRFFITLLFCVFLSEVSFAQTEAKSNNTEIKTERISPGSGRARPRPADGWETNLDWAFDRAKHSGQPLLLYFTSKNSPPCQAMVNEVLPDENVVDELRQVEQVRINVDEQPAMAGHYKIDQLPTYIVLDTDGTEYDRFSGFLPPQAFVEALRLAIDPDLSIDSLTRRIAKNKKDLQARWILAQKYARDRNRPALDKVLDQMRQIDPQNRKKYLDNVAYLEIMTTLNPRLPSDGVIACERFIKEFKRSEFADQIALTLAHLYYQMGDRNKAIRLLEKFPRNYPKSSLAHQVKNDLKKIRKGL